MRQWNSIEADARLARVQWQKQQPQMSSQTAACVSRLAGTPSNAAAAQQPPQAYVQPQWLTHVDLAAFAEQHAASQREAARSAVAVLQQAPRVRHRRSPSAAQLRAKRAARHDLTLQPNAHRPPVRCIPASRAEDLHPPQDWQWPKHALECMHTAYEREKPPK